MTLAFYYEVEMSAVLGLLRLWIIDRCNMWNIRRAITGCKKLSSRIQLSIVLFLLVRKLECSNAGLIRDAKLHPQHNEKRPAQHGDTPWSPSELNSEYAVSKANNNMDLRTLQRSKREIEPIIMPHKCYKTSPGFLAGFSQPRVVYTCVPQVLEPQTGIVSDQATPDILIPEEKKANATDTGLPESVPTTRNPRDIYALSNATLQFEVPDDVTTLRLWYQRIVSVEDGAFLDLQRLRELNLQHNLLSYLGVKAFEGLSQLTELDLSYNRLHSILSLTFNELENLEVLTLHHNELYTVQNGMLCGLRALSTLDLSHNAIIDIEPHALRHFRSTYTVAIEVGHNRLTTPRREWLRRGPIDEIDPICQFVQQEDGVSVFEADSAIEAVPKKMKSADGMEIVVKKLETKGSTTGILQSSKIVLPPVRMLSGAHNPWSCVCDTKFCPIQFLRFYKSIVTSQFNWGSLPDDIEIFQANEINLSSTVFPSKKNDMMDIPANKSDPGQYLKWYFTMPCDENGKFAALDLGRLSEKEQLAIEKTCCAFLTNSEVGETILEEDSTLKKLCRPDDAGNEDEITESHVTIIGILIVFSTPILLTLCPDCNRTVAPSSGGGMVSGGKFGIMSVNTNNNSSNDGKFPGKDERRPFSERFCLVVQSDKKSPRTFYVEEAV